MVLLDSIVVGARGSPQDVALFARAEVILLGEDGLFERLDNGTLSPLTRPEWLSLLHSGQAVTWPTPIRSSGHLWLWWLGEDFGPRQELLDEVGSALLDLQMFPRRWGLVVDEEQIPRLRESWSQRSLELARASPDPQTALRHARRSWLMAPAQTPAIVAYLIYCLILTGDEMRARGYQKIEREANGEDFDRKVEEELTRLGLRDGHALFVYNGLQVPECPPRFQVRMTFGAPAPDPDVSPVLVSLLPAKAPPVSLDLGVKHEGAQWGAVDSRSAIPSELGKPGKGKS